MTSRRRLASRFRVTSRRAKVSGRVTWSMDGSRCGTWRRRSSRRCTVICLAGGTELATACDLVYVAEDAQIGYPPVRSMSTPDTAYHPWLMGMRRAMELMLTGDSISGIEAVQYGFANRAFPADKLEEEVLNWARRVAKIPRDLQALNKRVVHRAMEIMGARAAIRSATEIQALCFHQPSSREYMKNDARGRYQGARRARLQVRRLSYR